MRGAPTRSRASQADVLNRSCMPRPVVARRFRRRRMTVRSVDASAERRPSEALSALRLHPTGLRLCPHHASRRALPFGWCSNSTI